MNDVSYKIIDGRNFMLITCSETGKNIDTQIKMLTSGGMKSIMPVRPTSKNGVPILQYDITGLTRLSDTIQHGKLDHGQFAALVEGMISTFDDCGDHALTADGISLENDCIYFDTTSRRAKFAYIPTLREGGHIEKCKETLRMLYAYGKLEHSPLTAAVSDAINGPSFAISHLKEVLRNHGSQQPNPAVAHSPPHVSHVAPVHAYAVSVPPAQHEPSVNTAASVSPIAAPQPLPGLEAPVQPAKILPKRPGIPKKTLIIAAVAGGSLLLTIGACFTPVVRLADGSFDFTKLLGILILFGALDFLILRKHMAGSPEPAADSKPERKQKEKKPKPVRDKAKPPAPPFLSAPPPAPSAETRSSPAPTALPQQPAPTTQPPAYQAASSFNTSPARTPPPSAPLPPPIPQSNMTMVLDDEDPAPAGLYLQMESGEEIILSKSPFLIGREAHKVDCTLNDTTVGRIHAEIIQQGGAWYVTDRNSTNHTYTSTTPLLPHINSTSFRPGIRCGLPR